MFTRLKKLAQQKPRQLIVACLYGIYNIFAITNIIVNRGALTPLDLGILVPSFALLSGAIAHGIGRSIHSVATMNEDDENQNNPDNQLIRTSTHNIANSLMGLGSSAGFITYDALILSRTIPLSPVTNMSAVAVRTTGLGLWNLATAITLFHAIAHDRRQENYPDEEVRALGLHPATYNLSAELLLIISAVMFSYQFYTESPLNPYKCTAIPMWLLAGSISTFAAIHDFIRRNDTDEDVELGVVPANGQNNNNAVVDVTDEHGEWEDVVIDPPGSFH